MTEVIVNFVNTVENNTTRQYAHKKSVTEIAMLDTQNLVNLSQNENLMQNKFVLISMIILPMKRVL